MAKRQAHQRQGPRVLVLFLPLRPLLRPPIRYGALILALGGNVRGANGVAMFGPGVVPGPGGVRSAEGRKRGVGPRQTRIQTQAMGNGWTGTRKSKGDEWGDDG